MKAREGSNTAPWHRRRWLKFVVAAVLVVVLIRGYLKPYRVVGSSDAPTYLIGDLILVNELAYDVRIPYTNLVIFSHSEPERGEVVQFYQPGNDQLVFKRIVGCPGDTLQLHNHHLTINSVPLDYQSIQLPLSQEVAIANQIGSVVEREKGNGTTHLITYSSTLTPEANLDEFKVPRETCFLVGDNRGNSHDSRNYGPIPKQSIVGRVSPPIRINQIF